MRGRYSAKLCRIECQQNFPARACCNSVGIHGHELACLCRRPEGRRQCGNRAREFQNEKGEIVGFEIDFAQDGKRLNMNVES